jgi:glycosyltransferase involved in cell wall biosynthesis
MAKRQAFQNADAYLFPSWTEGLPISVLEAMAQGLPLVACAVGGLPDFFQDGRMGFLTDRRDPEVLASLMSRLILNPGLCSSIARFNRTYAREHFRPTHIAARLEDIYRSVSECIR